MKSSLIFMLLLQIVLIGLNAVFACAEIAIISVNDNKMAKMAAEGNKRAKRLIKLTEQPARFLSTIQVAITLSGFLGSAFAAENFSGSLVELLIGWGVNVPAEILDSIAVVVITLVAAHHGDHRLGTDRLGRHGDGFGDRCRQGGQPGLPQGGGDHDRGGYGQIHRRVLGERLRLRHGGTSGGLGKCFRGRNE